MKTFRLFLWVIVASLAFAACSDDEGEDLGGRYKVTVTADDNGKAVANPAEAEAGEKITLTATANEGFVFATWTIESGNVTLADATAAETSFTMPKGDVVIRASFAEGVKEYADILPLLQDEIFKEYAQNRMNYPASIEFRWQTFFCGGCQGDSDRYLGNHIPRLTDFNRRPAIFP